MDAMTTGFLREAQRVADTTDLPLIEAASMVFTVGYEPPQRLAIARALAERVPAAARAITHQEETMQTHTTTTEAPPPAYDQMATLATERARRTGKTFAQAFSDVMTERPDLYRQYTEEEARRHGLVDDDPARRIIQSYHEELAKQARIDDPTLTEAQAYVEALDKLTPNLKALVMYG